MSVCIAKGEFFQFSSWKSTLRHFLLYLDILSRYQNQLKLWNTEKIRTTWKYKRCFVSWLRTPSRGSLWTIRFSLFGQRTQTFHISAFLLCSGIPPTGILNNQVLYLIKSVHRLMVKNLWRMLPKYFKFIFQKWRIFWIKKWEANPRTLYQPTLGLLRCRLKL